MGSQATGLDSDDPFGLLDDGLDDLDLLEEKKIPDKIEIDIKPDFLKVPKLMDHDDEPIMSMKSVDPTQLSGVLPGLLSDL